VPLQHALSHVTVTALNHITPKSTNFLLPRPKHHLFSSSSHSHLDDFGSANSNHVSSELVLVASGGRGGQYSDIDYDLKNVLGT
jgi:hypothetical protein